MHSSSHPSSSHPFLPSEHQCDHWLKRKRVRYVIVLIVGLILIFLLIPFDIALYGNRDNILYETIQHKQVAENINTMYTNELNLTYPGPPFFRRFLPPALLHAAPLDFLSHSYHSTYLNQQPNRTIVVAMVDRSFIFENVIRIWWQRMIERLDPRYTLSLIIYDISDPVQSDIDVLIFNVMEAKKWEYNLMYPDNLLRIFWTAEPKFIMRYDTYQLSRLCDIYIDCKDILETAEDIQQHIQPQPLPIYLSIPWYWSTNEGNATNMLLPNRFMTEQRFYTQKRKFCAYMYSHDVPHRVKLYRQLSKYYKQVDALGYSQRKDKRKKIEDFDRYAKKKEIVHQRAIQHYLPYKFVISAENVDEPGYVSEKLMHALLADSIPIYWGSKSVKELWRGLNPNRFLYVKDYGSLDELWDVVEYLDHNDTAYLSMVNQPIFINDHIPDNQRGWPTWMYLEEIMEKAIGNYQYRVQLHQQQIQSYVHAADHDINSPWPPHQQRNRDIEQHITEDEDSNEKIEAELNDDEKTATSVH